MGWNLTKACVLATLPMSDRARIVLVRMSIRTMDRGRGKKEPDTYYGGWDWLGLPWADGIRTEVARKQIVARAIRELIDRGLIKPLTNTTSPGARQGYLILVDYLATQDAQAVDKTGDG